MIRSGVVRLVDAALKDLAPQQLGLFIQSFGIPIPSMTRLLETLDSVDPSLLTNFDEGYMCKLVQVCCCWETFCPRRRPHSGPIEL